MPFLFGMESDLKNERQQTTMVIAKTQQNQQQPAK